MYSLPIIKVKKLYEDAQLPKQSDKFAAGVDLFVHRIEEHDNYIKVFSGIAVEPSFGFYLELVPRSSIYKLGLTLYNSIGILDQNYRGEIIGVFLKTPDFKELPKVGDRVMQVVHRQTQPFTIREVTELSDTNRGSGGFGSTGA